MAGWDPVGAEGTQTSDQSASTAASTQPERTMSSGVDELEFTCVLYLLAVLVALGVGIWILWAILEYYSRSRRRALEEFQENFRIVRRDTQPPLML